MEAMRSMICSRPARYRIIEHNIHGVDIDPRATQIAGLSLWLRAQRAWAEQGIPAEQRPVVRRSQIVCAEPMPGEKELLREFVEQEFPLGERAVFLPLLESVFDLMQLAGEAGSLLQIEEDIRSAIADAKLRWKATPRTEQIALFDEETIPTPEHEEMSLDFSGITDEEFWEKAEERIYDSLRTFAESAGGGYQRRLFAEDAARGFAFIDLCRQRYDVVLMNPPFGDSSISAKKYLETVYGEMRIDLYRIFVELYNERLEPSGFLGAISGRNGFFVGQAADWRKYVILRLFKPHLFADLGSGVLDAAVDTAAYVLRKLNATEEKALLLSLANELECLPEKKRNDFGLNDYRTARKDIKGYVAAREIRLLVNTGAVGAVPGKRGRYIVKSAQRGSPGSGGTSKHQMLAIRLIDSRSKADDLQAACRCSVSDNRFLVESSLFGLVPSTPFSYWASASVLRLFSNMPTLLGSGHTIRQGLETADDYRFVRLWWEIEPRLRLSSSENSKADQSIPNACSIEIWSPYAKGGTSNATRTDIHLVINWRNNGAELKAWTETLYDNSGWSRLIQSVEFYFKPGLAFGRRVRRFGVTPLPKGAIFSGSTPTIFFQDYEAHKWLRCYLSSDVARSLLGFLTVPRKMEVGCVGAIPIPKTVSPSVETQLNAIADAAWNRAFLVGVRSETDICFVSPRANFSLSTTVEVGSQSADDLISELLGMSPEENLALLKHLASATGIASESGDEDASLDDTDDAPFDDPRSSDLEESPTEYALGCAFGRWDIRYATGERPAPEPPDPFAPLPVCPPGMLQNGAGLPAAPGDVPASYPVPITWSGILVDDANHPDDIERRLREVLAVIFPDRTDAILQEACDLLGVKSLREWTAKPAGLFADHLKRYSKSRRQAPIYWPLSTASGSYTLWIYYHRLTPDTLYKCIERVQKKIEDDVEPAIHRLRTMIAAEEAGTRERKQLADAESLLTELREFHADLSHWAPRWKPNLNDGVQITASPLWKLFRLPKWQKTLKETWQKLEKGDYDWAHLAHTLWPDRVREKCKKDRSLAIAHDLEDLCEVKTPEPKKKAAKKAAKKKGETNEQEKFL